MECFEHAIERNQSYALAYSGIAEAHVLQTLISGFNAREQWNRIRLATDPALRLDPCLAEAHTAAGIASFFLGWDWPSAERSVQRAIELNPNYAVAHQFYAHLLSNWQRRGGLQRDSRNIDPLTPMMHTAAGAISQSRFVPPYAFAVACAGLSDDDATLEWLERACAARDIGLVFLPCDLRWAALRLTRGSDDCSDTAGFRMLAR